MDTFLKLLEAIGRSYGRVGWCYYRGPWQAAPPRHPGGERL